MESDETNQLVILQECLKGKDLDDSELSAPKFKQN